MQTCYGYDILLQHVVQLYQDELENGLNISTKLNHDHVYPTQLSVMTVKYVVLILSKTVAMALFSFKAPKSTATAKYCEKIDLFFHYLRV